MEQPKRLSPDAEGPVFWADKQQNKPNIANRDKTAIIACGALAHEIVHLIKINDFQHLQLFCLPANLHNKPKLIVPELEKKVTELRAAGFVNILIGYGDCGTGGKLDDFIEKENLTRIAGNHCYAFFAGLERFEDLMEQELGTFFLTDYMAKFFDHLIMRGMGIDKHPELRDMYFGNYKKLVYLAQISDEKLDREAERAAQLLGLSYERLQVDYGLLNDFIADTRITDNGKQSSKP